MANLFNGNQPFDDTIHLRGMAPLDDREVFVSLSDVYIDYINKTDSPLYNRAYKGMKITVFESDGTATVMSLKNSTPYSPDNTSINVTSSNYETYWTVIGKGITDKITDVIDPSINKLETYVRATNITNNNGGINITSTNGTNGRTYNVSVNVDNDTIKLVSNKVTGGKYKIEKLESPTNDMLASYRLTYQAPGSTTYVNLSDDVIDIPKDYVLKEVHQCKASYNSNTGKYTETSQPNTTAWTSDTNSVYLHFTWQTQDSDTVTSETYLKVSDVIALDIAGLDASVSAVEKHISSVIDPSINKLETHVIKVIDPSINKLETNLSALTTTVSTNETNRKADDASIVKRINAIDSSIANDYIYFNGGETAKTRAMLTGHGQLAKGTTIAQLEAMTTSEILKQILFEIAVPVCTQEQSLTIAWASGSSYKSMMDVSCPLPTSSEFTYTYKPEKWNWTSSDGTVSGTEVTLSEEASHTYMKASSSSASGSSSWSGHSTTGTNGYYYVSVTYTGLNDAVDSLGSTTDTNGTEYRLKRSGTVTSSNRLTFTTGYRVYSNANVLVNSGSSTVWNNRNTSPGSFKGNDNQTQSTFFADGTTAIYAQWPAALTSSQYMYIYIPTTQKITAVNSANANASNTWDWEGFDFVQVGDSVTILNQYKYPVSYNKYELTTDSTGIKTVKITVATA